MNEPRGGVAGGVGERDADQGAADAFFARTYTPDQITVMRTATPPELLARWRRDCQRARAEYTEKVAVADRQAERERQVRIAAKRVEVARKAREAQERKEARRVRAREWYAQHRTEYLEYQRQWRAQASQKDPEHYRERRNRSNKRWYDAHREQEQTKARDRYHDNPAPQIANSARRYEENTEHLKAQRRERYWNNREQENASHRRWVNREKLRRQAGLPTRATHTVPPAQRHANQDAADQFFTRPVTPERRARLADEAASKPLAEQIRRGRQSRTRINSTPGAEPRPGVVDRSEARHVAAQVKEHERTIAQAAEDARMDAIARAVNARLRQHPRHPTPLPGVPPTGGLHR